ncbi:MAG: hypothetical protein WCR45_01695 [Bacteroidaceae bacterium]
MKIVRNSLVLTSLSIWFLLSVGCIILVFGSSTSTLSTSSSQRSVIYGSFNTSGNYINLQTKDVR